METGRTLHRRRTGFIARKPTIDARNGLVYVPTTGAGKILVFDRESFELLGQLPIGNGTRFVYATRNGRWLVGGNLREHFFWDAAELARSFRGSS